ncbi:hypothetical protein [Bosea sp. TAB14]|uniref:hypothetical protein n=1 Tax=Bosea sp. TAB14 TaxID=3237481 RepID=UPI003F9016E8
MTRARPKIDRIACPWLRKPITGLPRVRFRSPAHDHPAIGHGGRAGRAHADAGRGDACLDEDRLPLLRRPGRADRSDASRAGRGAALDR